MTRSDLVAALELYDSVDWADDDPTPEFWRDAYQLLADGARAYLAQFQKASTRTQWLCDYPEFGDTACITNHNPAGTHLPRKHSGCGWYLTVPLGDEDTP